MDILNFISWIRGGRQVTTVDPAKTVLPVGLKDNKRDDGYLAGVITVEDLAAQIGGGPVVDSEGNLIVADSSKNTVNVGPGGVHYIPNFSGMLLVNDHNDGGVELWIAGGGASTVLINKTPYGPGNGDLKINGGIDGYAWHNVNNQAGPFTFTVIKTRNQA